GIVRSGQMVALDTVSELRSGGPRRYEVEAPSAPTGWADGIVGVTVLSHQNGRTVVELADDVDDQTVLKTALQTGPVREFAQRRPSLTELFRHVVSAEEKA